MTIREGKKEQPETSGIRGRGDRRNASLDSCDDAAGHIGRERVRPARDLKPRKHAGGVACRAALLRVAAPRAGKELFDVVAPRYGLSSALSETLRISDREAVELLLSSQQT